MPKFTTTAAYVSGGICGSLWWPAGSLAGKPVNADLRAKMACFSEPASFRDALDSLLMEEGGDFNGAAFTADTVIRVERRCVDAPGKYRVHVWEREIGQLRECGDLVNGEAFTGDFMGEDA